MEPLEVSPASPTRAKASPTPSTSSMRARMAAGLNGISTRALPFRHGKPLGPKPPSPLHRNPTSGAGGFNLNSLGGLSALQNIGGLLNPLTEFKDNIRQKAENAAAKKKIDKVTADKKLMVLIAYIMFLLAYSITAMHGRHDASLDPYTIYDMQKSLVDQLSGSQFKPYPDGKQVYNINLGNMTLDGVSTVKDMYSWLRTTFHNGIYSANTFDGDPRFRGGGRNGFVFGQQMLLGGIRISQYRTPKYDCMEKAPKGLFSDLYATFTESEKNETLTDQDVTDDEQDAEWESGYYCYQNDENQHTTPYANSTFECDDENFDWTDPPSQCSGPFWGGYKYKPLVNEEVQASILSNMGYELRSPGFSKILPNRNGTEAAILYATLYQSKFVDLQTRYLFIDMAFWNFNVERLITIRFTFDMPLSGGVYPSAHVKVADLYTCNIATLDDVQLCDRRHIIRMSFEVACLVVITLVALIVILQICLTVFKICTWQFNVAHCCVEEDAWWDFRAKKSRESEVRRYLYLHSPYIVIFVPTSTNSPAPLSPLYQLSTNAEERESTLSKSPSKKPKKKTLFKMMRKVIGAKGGAWWFWNMFLILQLAVYYAYLGSRYVAMVLVPTNVDPASDSYIDFQTPATWANYSDRINALFIFLSWVRLFEFISFFSNHGLFLFVLMFFVFMSGSALSNQIAFGYYVENYSSFLSSFFTTLKALQGKLPYDDISNMMQSGLAGTVFGLVYVLILIYILAHLVLALIFALGQYMRKMFQLRPTISLVTLPPAIIDVLDQRRTKRRALRRSLKKPLTETVRDYLKDCPSVANSEESYGELGEFDLLGNVKTKYNFFNPPGPMTLRPMFRCAGGGCEGKGRYCCRGQRGRKMRRFVSEGGSVTDEDDEDCPYFSPCNTSEDELALLEEGFVAPYQSSINHISRKKCRSKQLKPEINSLSDLQKDPMMEMFLGKDPDNADADDDDSDSDGTDTFRKSRNQVLGVLSKFGDVVTQSANGSGGGDDGSKILTSSIRKVESLMTMGGLFGVRKRAVSDHRRSSNNGMIPHFDPHHPEVIREHSTRVMEKLNLFADMSIKVGNIFENDPNKTQAAVAKLIDCADIGTGQLRLDIVLKFFGEIGMKIGPNTQETLHALFGRKKEEIDDIVKDDGHGHTCLTAFGLQVSLPHVRIESLSLVLLSAIPLMSGNKKMRDILPQLTKLDIVGRLASDLIEHVANMLSIHVERASSGVPGVLLPDGVVHGLDLIFNMMSASLDTVVSAEWRGTAEGLLERIRDGVHSLSDYPDEGLQGEISNYSKKLRETLNRGDSTKMDVAHLESRMKRRLSTVLGTGLVVHQKTAELGLTAHSKNEMGRAWTSKWGKVQAISHTIGSYSPEKNKKHKKDEAIAEVDDFLSSVMAEHVDEDEFFESRV
ncbi:hypothetical protein TL16_g03070 [Triparma laevis f. inornata]|uniref:Uncharacterized protein n=1 Tax=Triparma laevis f. inornata TaxID=1714386 RepID=A0A9W6ZYZ7_9STRA|nr:hypothetical protein TL16_g03070 [Triparma laevis f. inornata]